MALERRDAVRTRGRVGGIAIGDQFAHLVRHAGRGDREVEQSHVRAELTGALGDRWVLAGDEGTAGEGLDVPQAVLAGGASELGLVEAGDVRDEQPTATDERRVLPTVLGVIVDSGRSAIAGSVTSSTSISQLAARNKA